MEGFGDLAEPQPLGDETTSRCGLVTLVEAAAVQRALAAASRSDGPSVCRLTLTGPPRSGTSP